MREPLWYREFRRASRRTNDSLSGQVLVSLVAAGAGALVSVWLSHHLEPWWTETVSAVMGVVAGPILFGVALFIYFWCKYRSWPKHWFQGEDEKRRFQDEDWTAMHDVTESGDSLLLKLSARPGFSIDPSVEIELLVKSGGRWAVVPSRNVRPYAPNLIVCQLDSVQPLYPGGFYEARWYRRDRGKFVEITREAFQLKNHVFGALTRSESRTG